MNSYNHYAYGAIGDWMYRVMVGLDTDPDSVGYKKIIIRPHPGGGFTQAAATYDTHYGVLRSGWTAGNGKLTLEAEIPANTTATIFIPAREANAVMENGKPLSVLKDIQMASTDSDYVAVNVGSGTYRFTSDWQEKTGAANLAQYAGKYETVGASFPVIVVTVNDGKLVVEAENMGGTLRATDTPDFFTNDATTATFARDANGNVAGISIEYRFLNVKGKKK